MKVNYLLVIFLLILTPVSLFAGGPKATLTWEPPTTLEDGTPLVDLLGYKIYWGLSSGDYSDERFIDVGNVTSTELEFTADLNRFYYFVATAYREPPCPPDEHCESKYSNEVTKYIDGRPSMPSMVGVLP